MQLSAKGGHRNDELANEKDFVNPANFLCYIPPHSFIQHVQMADSELDLDATGLPSSPDISGGLSTLQRNALAQFLQRRDFTPHDIAQFEYAQIARLPKVGKKGIEAIRQWLRQHGCDLRRCPDAEQVTAHQRVEQRLDKALRLLKKNGYEVQAPKK